MKVSPQRVVSFHYTLTNSRGDELESSKDAQPFTYLHGADRLIPGLERELEGCEPGDEVQAAIEPKDAYGEVDPRLIVEVPLEQLAGIEKLRVGMRLESRSPEGQVRRLTVDSIGEQTATLNANHALAGEVLNFDVCVEDVRDATSEEIERGVSR